MEVFVSHINDNWRLYSLFVFLLSCLALFWLSKYFATKTELADHKDALDAHKVAFDAHKLEHYKLRDTVKTIDSHLAHLPDAKESQALREELALTRGRLEGVDTLLKQILNNQNMLFENELRGSNMGKNNGN
ncbi:DUF2730 family protein [uncultured Paraglaciecola sp.]|uniref:DUF2730 family protein n=1 Tax=uncultured Paraglaciecola sp. TaxID=1765024 RepID=UPI0026280B9C|nr:DUF2730 family protein [uncultured Paraglaciecola sp.]